jgi:protein PhnA
MGSDGVRCLRCGDQFEYDNGDCPSCGWSSSEFRARNRYNLARPGTGEWERD